MKKNILILALVAFMAFTAKGQATIVDMLSGTSTVTGTVTNTGTDFLTSPVVLGNKNNVSVQFTVTKVSGTVAGTVSLLVSLDGTNFKAATLVNASTALHTFTATDVASQNFVWALTSNPYAYYRVSYTGTGTMAATFTAKLLTR